MSISRQWQFAVELINLRSFAFESTDLSVFANLFRPSQRHRHVLVKSFRFHVALPSYSGEACYEYETEDEKETNSQVFSEAIHGPFKVLKEVKNGDGIFLNVVTYSPMDTYRRPNADMAYLDPKDLWGKRYQASFLQLRNPEQLPVLSSVSDAAHHAPSLEVTRLGVPNKLYGSICFDFWYVAKGVPNESEEEPDDKARVIWQVGDWRPDEEVERHWRNVISSDGVMLYNTSDW